MPRCVPAEAVHPVIVVLTSSSSTSSGPRCSPLRAASTTRAELLTAVTRPVAGPAPERRAQPQVGWQRSGERADAQAAPAVDLEGSPDQQWVGAPVGEHQGAVLRPERYERRRALRLPEGVRRRLISPATAQQNARRLQSKTSTSPGRSSVCARPLARTTGGLAAGHSA
jgi:hypothetical protein